MAISKQNMLVFFCALFICIGMVGITNVNANVIDYDAIKADVSPGCSPKHPNLCKTHEANPYERGCNAINQCRGGEPVVINAIEKIDMKHNDIIESERSESKAGTDEGVGKFKGMVKDNTRKINPGALENISDGIVG